MIWLVIGAVFGCVIAFVSIKREIKKNGATQLKICSDCPYAVKCRRLEDVDE